MTEVRFTVNGAAQCAEVEPRLTLADMLREECGLTGTHLGCEHGVCGACTVLMDGLPVRGCLVFGVQAEGADIRTVEGLAAPDGTLNVLQRAFQAQHGLQCGFCTPGFLMLATWMLEQPGGVDEARLRDVLASNLCRCTGYQNILAAVRAAAQEMGVWKG
ncbi:(2Fe-2S)-binding protein [Roseococcus suduntuyensis]|uniref:Carbon-monoxide dehydrogenase small subunit n=1 Tax=Roseococcus suduntuyensis TaxID=455361 RepID=A0A840A8V0_9PROT|nr:(2Fe-2S)-binding protein [Roseococcus suduntuyensis]MBB3896615.1 carbon-monoxide dehydrogenase small subunit [Roseococcus suduntuyensis]